MTPRGRIVIGGTTGDCHKGFCSDFAIELARFRANGDRDTSFGTNGVVARGLPDDPGAYAIALDSSGRIVAVGYSSAPGTSNTFTVERYLPDGSLDPGFGSGGTVRTPFSSCTAANAYSVVIDGSGDLVVAGFCSSPSGANGPALARYGPDGALDSGFGPGGTVTTQFASGYPPGFFGVGLGSDGKITVGGMGMDPTTGRSAFLLARYTSAGALDQGFGSGGTVTTRLRGS